MKTPEEIRLAVLKECERLCPTKMGRFLIGDGMYIKHGMNGWVISAVDGTELFDLLIFNENSAPAILLSAYRILNIEARELEERAQGLVDGEHFVDVKLQNPSYVAISPERLAELERIEALYNERIELLGENVNPDALWEKMQLNADKAAKWDTFGPKMRYIINTFEDLEGLKP